MIDPMGLPNQILGNIMQNFPAMQMPMVQNNTERADGVSSVSEAGGATVSFSEALAERLAESSYLENYAIQNIINEELATIVGNHSTEIVSLLNLLDGSSIAIDNPLALFNNMMNAGADRSDILSMLNIMNGNSLNNQLSMMMNLPSSLSSSAAFSGSSAMMGLADPFDLLRHYGALIRQ